MACLPCERARLARLGKLSKMAKKLKTSKKSPATRRKRRVGSMGGKLANRSITVQFMDLLYVAGGAILNYAVVNPAINKLTEKMKKKDGTPMLGEHQGKILTAAKGVGAGYAAYAIKMPKEAKLALFGVAGASGVELAGQFMPDKMIALSGTGDLFMGVGNTMVLDIPMRRKKGAVTSGAPVVYGTDDIAVYGTGDVFSGAL